MLTNAPFISAKEGINIREVLEADSKRLPCPKGRYKGTLKCINI